jgi:hypothetical protein
MKSALFTSALALVAAGGLLASTAASAITYSGSFSASDFVAGSGSLKADYTITTDGTLGTLSARNYTGYTLSINYNNLIRDSSGTGVFSGIETGGSATASQLSFDFGSPGNTMLFFDGSDALCFYAVIEGGCVGEPTPSSSIYFGPLNASGYLPRSSDVAVIATSGAVPEPANWAMLVAGFGLVGAAARRRKAAVTA